ncbi:hypothetical protein K1T71_011865 [Dendrolimus kikuchii]|uniref:Uncharacterized protein n=1 Tax=Dendrolimus kikuchii TaxID=765133 RepID=A0ACC1CMC1_9NEOP|nr:hypothetical protein K1T71_011865 [Dendrolimus kikuchii]
MELARPLSELNMDGASGPVDRVEAWKKWRPQFMLFLKASGVHAEPSSVQALSDSVIRARDCTTK